MELNMQQETFEDRDKRAQVTGCQLHAPTGGDEGWLQIPTWDKSWPPGVRTRCLQSQHPSSQEREGCCGS